MHHAGLHKRIRPGRLDRLRESRQPVATDDEYVPDAAIGQLSAYPGPELRAFSGLNPDPEDVFDTVHVHPDRDVSGLVANVCAIADLHHDRVEIDHRIERFKRATLPGQDFVEDLVGDLGDGLAADLGADRGRQVMLDIAHGHPARVQRDDHVVQTTHTA
jgi:hypothetical protein